MERDNNGHDWVNRTLDVMMVAEVGVGAFAAIIGSYPTVATAVLGFALTYAADQAYEDYHQE